MIIDAIVTNALYVDASLSYLIVILLNDFNHPKNLSTALLIFLYCAHWYVRLYTAGFRVICCICISLLESCSLPGPITMLRGMESLFTHVCILEPFLCLKPSYLLLLFYRAIFHFNSLSILSHTPSSFISKQSYMNHISVISIMHLSSGLPTLALGGSKGLITSHSSSLSSRNLKKTRKEELK
jgi:hypothetical protein